MIEARNIAPLADWRKPAEDLIALIAAQRDAYRAALKLDNWKVTTGSVSPADAPRLSADWEDAVIPYDWSPRDYSVTLHYSLRLDASMLGVNIIGSRVTAELWAPTGGSVYVNGKLAYDGRYWADTQVVPIVLTESLAEAAAFDIVLQSRQGDGFGLFFIAEASITALDDRLFELDMLAEELAFALHLAGKPEAGTALRGQLAAAVASFDEAAVKRRVWATADVQIASLRAALEGFETLAKAYKVFMAGHAHIDMNWLWPQEETEDLVRRDFESMDGIMEEYPDVCFSHSQAATYLIAQRNEPALFENIKKRIGSGRWEVTASTWVEGDLNLAGYETLARQFLEGMTYSREQLGANPEVCWEPDTFGHPATMPQVLSQAGIRYYYHTRPAGRTLLYWWEGPDGSRVLAFNDPRVYFGRVYPSLIIPDSIRMEETYGLSCNLYVYGIGDHGGGVTRNDVKRAIRMRSSKLLPEIVFSPTVDFFKEAERSGVELPVYKGEINNVFEGCYSSHGDIKKANRETEHKLVRAETIASIAGLKAGGVGRVETAARLREAWRTQCFHQFHDILCGCSIRQTYDEAIPASLDAAAQADLVAAEATGAVSSGALGVHASASVSAETVTLWNALSWDRTDTVELLVAEYPQLGHWRTGDLLEDREGRRTAVQRTEDEILFIAYGVPSLGHKRYRRIAAVAEATGGEQAIEISKAGNPVLTGDRMTVEIDRDSGTIVSLVDRTIGRELSYTPPNPSVEANQTKGLLNLLELQYEAPHWMSAWKLGTITKTVKFVSGADIRLGEQGPVMQSVHVEHRFENSVLRQEIRVYRGVDRIEFRNRVQWGELGSQAAPAPMLRVSFTPKLKGTTNASDIPFGAIEREPDGRETPANHWIDLSEENYGLSLLNDGKYGHSIQGNTLGLTLIRSSYEPDNLGDFGDHHRFSYALYPHEGSWRDADTVNRGWEFNQPIWAVVGDDAGSASAADWSALRVVEVDGGVRGLSDAASSVIVTAFKQARSGDGEWIIRIVETEGRSAVVRLDAAFPVEEALWSNLLEEPGGDAIAVIASASDASQTGILVGPIAPWQMRTIRIRA